MALNNLTKVQTLGIGSNIEVVGVITTGQFKSGTSNLHASGVELTNLNVSGIATIGGNLSIGGTLTYQDVTNIDSVGLITARSGINVSGGQLDVGSNIKLGNAGVITATSFVGSGANLTGIDASSISFGGAVKAQANAAGVVVTGILTATTVDISGDIDVDGHTNLDNVSIAGVATVTGALTASNGIAVSGDNISVAAATDIRFTNSSGTWTGSVPKIQHYGDHLYIVGGSNGIRFREGPTDRWDINTDGHFVPRNDSQLDIGTNALRVRNAYFDNLYGSGANLTSLPAAQLTGTLPAISGANLTNLPSSPPPNNFLINGAMLVNVRGTNHQTANSFNPVTSAIYTLDRWKVFNSNSFDTDSAKVVQDGGHPAQGFHRSIMMNIGNTETPSSNQICGFQQKIEAQNLQSLCYGQSTAKTMTLSFWVYSNKTGTYCVQIMQDDVNKYVLYEYTISSSNTWEKKTITIAGNTSDAINNDNGIGLEVNWTLCVGSGRQASATSSWTSGGYYVATSNQVNLWDHADNYFKMTGCQLQTGSTATDFVHEDISTTLRKCQRYFYMACGPDGGGYETIGTGMIYYSGTGYASCYFPVTMRTQPSLVALSGSSGAYMYQTLLSNTAAYTHQISLDSSKTSLNSASVSCACPSSRNGQAFRLSAHFSHDANAGQSFVNFDAEL